MNYAQICQQPEQSSRDFTVDHIPNFRTYVAAVLRQLEENPDVRSTGLVSASKGRSETVVGEPGG